MKAIQATPKNIKSIFSDSYIIPEFQRPYSWDETECLELLNDIMDFFMANSSTDENYYLGNIVLYPEKQKWAVIDGQQRLTTVMLLLSALFSQARTATVLEECLKMKDPITAKIVNKLKIESMVLENDKSELEDVVLYNNTVGNSRIKKNYQALLKKLMDWFDDNHFAAETINNFILTVLNKVVLLPIECDSMDDALIIFNTLNNRGMPLSDADIFKAKLFRFVVNDENAKKEFVKRWNDLNISTDGKIEDLFRKLMHINRAQKQDTSKEIGLRKYFEVEKIFIDWSPILTDLEKINALDEYTGFPPVIINLLKLLNYIPNDYCLYPIIVFWYKYSIKNENDNWILPENKLNELKNLLNNTVKYYYASAIAYNSVNTVKTTTYKVCCAIMDEKDYTDFYFKDYGKIYEQLGIKLENYEYGRCRFGLVALLAILNKSQKQQDILDFPKWQVEHILPQRGGYNNYNGWTEEQYNNKLNTIGNCVLLEKPLNIRASNEFFKKKKIEYEKSCVQEAKDLTKLLDWTFEEWQQRDKEKEKELKDFFIVK